jgi:COP9 signalosome complex subunit 2
MIKVIAPYQRISIKYLAQELNGIPEKDVEDLLVSLILERRINGYIDQVLDCVTHTHLLP